jgi:hypothetical protein
MKGVSARKEGDRSLMLSNMVPATAPPVLTSYGRADVYSNDMLVVGHVSRLEGFVAMFFEYQIRPRTRIAGDQHGTHQVAGKDPPRLNQRNVAIHRLFHGGRCKPNSLRSLQSLLVRSFAAFSASSRFGRILVITTSPEMASTTRSSCSSLPGTSRTLAQIPKRSFVKLSTKPGVSNSVLILQLYEATRPATIPERGKC